MSISIYYCAKRNRSITIAERAAVDSAIERYAVEDRIEEYFETGEGPNWESFTEYDLTAEDDAADIIFQGATKLPDSSEEDFETGVRHWCELLTQIRRTLHDTEWTVSIDDVPVDWDPKQQAFIPPV